MKLSPASCKGTGFLISRVSAAWTAADKSHGRFYGVTGKEFSLCQNALVDIRGNQNYKKGKKTKQRRKGTA